jgi:hypothetical protein
MTDQTRIAQGRTEQWLIDREDEHDGREPDDTGISDLEGLLEQVGVMTGRKNHTKATRQRLSRWPYFREWDGPAVLPPNQRACLWGSQEKEPRHATQV